MTTIKNYRLVAKSRIAFDAASKRVYDKVNGYLRVSDNPFTREQVAQYRGREIPNGEANGLKPNEIYNVYRPASELSKPETIASLKEIPLLLEHATYDPQNPPKERVIGAAGSNPVWEAPYLKNSLTFHNAKAIHLLESGAMKELSLGYYYDPVFKKGTTKDGQSYDVIMTNIRANHIALVEEGRAGPDVAVHDSKPKDFNKGLQSMDKDENNAVTDNDDKIQTLLQLAIELAKQSGVPVPGSDSDDDPAEDEDEEVTDPAAPENNGAEDEDEEATEDEDEETAEDEDDDPTEDEGEEVAEDEDDDPTEDEDDDPTEDDDEEVAEDEGEDEEAAACDSDLSDEELAALLKESGLNPNGDLIEGVRLALAAIAKKKGPVGDSKHSLRKNVNNALISARISRELKRYRAQDRAKMQAAREVRGVLGNVDAMAYDSAGAIYRKALRKSGYSLKEVKGMKSGEARACFRGLSRGKASKRTLAKDSAKSKRTTNAQKSFNLLLQNIK